VLDDLPTLGFETRLESGDARVTRTIEPDCGD